MFKTILCFRQQLRPISGPSSNSPAIHLVVIVVVVVVVVVVLLLLLLLLLLSSVKCLIFYKIMFSL